MMFTLIEVSIIYCLFAEQLNFIKISLNNRLCEVTSVSRN